MSHHSTSASTSTLRNSFFLLRIRVLAVCRRWRCDCGRTCRGRCRRAVCCIFCRACTCRRSSCCCFLKPFQCRCVRCHTCARWPKIESCYFAHESIRAINILVARMVQWGLTQLHWIAATSLHTLQPRLTMHDQFASVAIVRTTGT